MANTILSVLRSCDIRRLRQWFPAALLAAIVTSVCVAPLVHRSSAALPGGREIDVIRQWEVYTVAELLAAWTQVAPAGGTIYLKPGSYVIDETLEIRGGNSVNVVGAGWNTRIIRRGEGDALRFIDSQFCVVRNLLLQGDESATSGSAIVFRGNCSSCTLDFCRIVNFPESGVRYEGEPTQPMSSNTLQNCHLIGNLGDQLWSFHNNDFYIIGSQFGTHRGYPHRGAVLDHSSAGTYCMNYHWGNHVALTVGPGANYNRIENNRFEESREAAVMLGAAESGDRNAFNIISGNTFHTNSQAKSGEFAAVIAYDTQELTFCGNQIFSWNADRYEHRHSLLIGRNCDRWIVKDNIFRHNTREAIVCDETKELIIKDNLTD